MSELHKHRPLTELLDDPATRDEARAIMAEINELARNHDLPGDPEAEALAIDAIDRFVRLAERP